MPHKSLKRRRACHAASAKRSRIYARAIANNLPEALEAERFRDPMRPANEMFAEMRRLTPDEQRARKPEYDRLYNACLDARPEAARRFKAARAAAIRAQQLLDLME